MNTEEVNIISGETKYVENKVNKFLSEKPHFKVVSTCSHDHTKIKKGKTKDEDETSQVTILTVTLAHTTR